MEVFFYSLPPIGILRVPRYKLVDIDEFGLTLEKCNQTGGWVLKMIRVRKDGHYHHGNKATVPLAVEPGDPRVPAGTNRSIEWPRRWIRDLVHPRKRNHNKCLSGFLRHDLL